MKNNILLFSIFTFLLAQVSFAQNEPRFNSKSDSPYKTKFAIDAPVTALGAGLSYYGLTLLNNKEGLSDAELAAIDADPEGAKQDVPKFDRFAAGWYSLDAKKASDFPFYGSFGMPLLLLLDDDIRGKAGQVGVLYLETMAITGAIFTLTAGNTSRSRPLVYNTDENTVETHERRRRNAQNSFFAGHTAASASAAFFAAKVFHDFNPDSKARPYVWAAAAAVPATVGYLRLKAGKHFLSDNLLGYTIGAGVGILVPQLHKKANKTGLSIMPVYGRDYEGVAVTYTLKR